MVALGTGSGCVSGPDGRSGRTGRSDDPATSSVPPEDAVEVPPCPTWPAEPTASSVADFVESFEVAYVTRTVLAENDRVTHVEFLELSDPEVVRRDEPRYVVRLRAAYTYGYRQSAGAEDTAVADSGAYHASYRVGPDVAERATARESPPDADTERKDVSCPPQTQ